jgi:hypothetical protein
MDALADFLSAARLKLRRLRPPAVTVFVLDGRIRLAAAAVKRF